MHRPRRSALVAMVLVLLMHVALVVLLLREAPGWRRGETQPVRPSVLWLREVPAPPVAVAPAPRVARKLAPSGTGKVRNALPRQAQQATGVAVLAAPAAEPAASTASAALPSLLDSDATRRAVREAARTPSMRERAAVAAGERAALTPEQRLGRDIEQAAIGDCLKGQYAGGGMGLLSLPFWLVAEARGKCRK